jgi:hypothetical protein
MQTPDMKAVNQGKTSSRSKAESGANKSGIGTPCAVAAKWIAVLQDVDQTEVSSTWSKIGRAGKISETAAIR